MNLTDEQLQTMPLEDLREIVYELGIDEAFELEREDLIDYYIDWA